MHNGERLDGRTDRLLTEGAWRSSEEGAVVQRLRGRAVLKDALVEATERLAGVLGRLPSCCAVLHRQQLGAQVMQPQHVGVGVVVVPVVPENKRRKAIQTGAKKKRLKKDKKKQPPPKNLVAFSITIHSNIFNISGGILTSNIKFYQILK